MNGNEYIKVAKTVSVILFMLLVLACSQKEQIIPPNIVIVITDDQGYGDLACHGNPIIKTPHMDAFHTQSLRLTNYHVGTTCAPTRAGLMTGRNCNRNGVWHTIGGASMLHEREYTMANLFSDNGYETGIFGKWHLGDSYPFRPQDRGFEESVVHGGGGVGQTPDYWNNDYFDDTYFHNGNPQQYEGYCTDVFFEEGLKFIEANKEQPFFTYISTNAPHSPLNLPLDYYNQYDDIEELTEYQKKFYGMITNIDDNFGRLISKLEELNLTDNTIIIFTTDNGSALRDPKAFHARMRGTKGSEYDGGHRVPFFIKWDQGGILSGRDMNSLAAHVDILPTLASLCGLEFTPPYVLDGMDVSSILRGEESKDKRMLVTDTQRVPWPVKGKNSCVIEGSYRLVNGDKLYNVANDPGQKNDIADYHSDLVKQMNVFYDNWWEDASTTFEYSLYKVGDDQQNPTVITIHDGHIEGRVPWHQGFIRKGEFSGVGPVYIDVVEAGNYKIEMSRYPKESGLAIGAAVQDGYPAKINYDAVPDGAALTFASAELITKSGTYEVEVDVSQQSVVFENVKLEEGFDEFSANFIKDDKSKYGAYYIYFTRI